MRLAVVGLLALTVAGCYGNPGPSPVGGVEDVIANLVLRDVTVTHTVSGDAGCSAPSLYDNAVHLTTSYRGQSADLYVFEWRRASDYEAAGTDFSQCVDEFRDAHPALGVATLNATPFRAYAAGATAPQPLMTVLLDALRDAGAT